MSALRSAGGKTRPEKWLNQLRCGEKPHANASTDLRSTLGTVTHSQLGPPDAPDTLRVHCVPTGLYQAAHKRAFFEPRPGTLQLFGKFNEPVKRLVAEWWNRIETSQQLFIQWSKESMHWLSTEPEARWQGHRMFLTAGITWSLHANHVAVKARFQQPCVFDASGSRLSPSRDVMSPEV